MSDWWRNIEKIAAEAKRQQKKGGRGKKAHARQRALPRTPRLEAARKKGYPKPTFEDMIAARKGDPVAQRKVNLYVAHLGAQREGEFVASHGGLQPEEFARLRSQVTPAFNPVVDTVLTGVYNTVSPFAWFPHVTKAVTGKGVNVPGVGADVALALPFLRPLKAIRAFRAARAAEDAAAAAKAAEGTVAATPEEKIAAAVKPARQTRAEIRKMQRKEHRERAQMIRPAFEQAGGGQAGVRAAKGALKGEFQTLPFNNLQGLSSQEIDRLMNAIAVHPALNEYDKVKLWDAVTRVSEGKAPRKFEIDLMEKAFGPEAADQLKEMSLASKVINVGANIANVPRAIMSSLDVSGLFRQALVAWAYKPRLVAKQIGPSLKAMFSEKAYTKFIQDLHDSPDFEEMLNAGVRFTELSGNIGKREEFFASSLAEKLTGGKYSFVRASGRNFTVLLDGARAAIYRDLHDLALDANIDSAKLRHDIARFANVVTGRGGLGPLEKAAVPLNTILFSPRLIGSRVAVLNPFWYASLDPLVRRKAIASTARLISAGMLVLAAFRLAGAKVGADPTNADFGKIRIGNTRIDLWGGHQQYIRLLAQIQQGRLTSSTTGKVYRLSGGRKLSRWEIAIRFGEGKMAPSASLVKDWAKNAGYDGKPFSWKRAVVSRVIPMVVQDLIDFYDDTGSALGAAGIYGVSATGIGVQTYSPLVRAKPKPTTLVQTGSLTDPYLTGDLGAGVSPAEPLLPAEQSGVSSDPYFNG